MKKIILLSMCFIAFANASEFSVFDKTCTATSTWSSDQSNNNVWMFQFSTPTNNRSQVVAYRNGKLAISDILNVESFNDGKNGGLTFFYPIFKSYIWLGQPNGSSNKEFFLQVQLSSRSTYGTSLTEFLVLNECH